MLYRKLGKTGCEVSALGVGCARLPGENGNVVSEAAEAVDEVLTTRIIHSAIEHGINYFDTAFIYAGGKSEGVLGKALKGGFREKVYLADKMPMWMVKEEGDLEKIFSRQLENLGTDYIDFYLLHGLNGYNWQMALKYNVPRFLDRIVADGRARFIGFSFHDEIQLFKEIVDTYNWSMCQIQLNYLDKKSQAGLEGLMYSFDKGLGVVIMEPLRGGILANQPKEAEDIWAEAEVKRTPVDWALRWLWNLPQISCVLSGMNKVEQLEENIKSACSSMPNALKESELELYDRVAEVYRSKSKVNCTGCAYCTPCPEGVNIPLNFSCYNEIHMFGDRYIPELIYSAMSSDKKAANCKNCGVCEKLCPQKIKIREKLKEVSREFI